MKGREIQVTEGEFSPIVNTFSQFAEALLIKEITMEERLMRDVRKIIAVMISVITTTIVFPPHSMAEFYFPLKSISPVTTPEGEQRVRIGASYNKGERLLFQQENRNRQVYELPSVGIAIGVAPNVELLFSYPMLLMNQDNREQNYGSGDLKIKAVFRMFRVENNFSNSALTVATKLPNASNQDELGTDETDFFVGGIISRNIGPIRLLINAEFGILGDPNRENTQDDVFEYKVGFIYPMSGHSSTALEIEGVEGSRRTNDRRFVRAGIAFNWSRFLIDLGGALGLSEESGDFQIAMGITMKYGQAREPVNCPQ